MSKHIQPVYHMLFIFIIESRDHTNDAHFLVPLLRDGQYHKVEPFSDCIAIIRGWW